MAAGIGMVGSGALSPMGAVLTISGGMGAAGCIVGLTAQTTSFFTGTPYSGVDTALSYTSLGGLTFSTAGSLMFGTEDADQYAALGSSFEKIALGKYGVTSARSMFELTSSFTELATGSYDFGRTISTSNDYEFSSSIESAGSGYDSGGMGGSHDSIFDSSFDDFWDKSFDGGQESPGMGDFDFGGDFDFDFGGDFDSDFGGDFDSWW